MSISGPWVYPTAAAAIGAATGASAVAATGGAAIGDVRTCQRN